MGAHIANGTMRYKDTFRYGEVLRASVDQIYIIKQDGNLYVISNNVKARVTTADIPATNGVLHIIDQVLAFPYKSVAETMADTAYLREFYEILSLDPEFLSQAKDETTNISVFAPSEGFLMTIGREKMKDIKNDFQVIRKIFAGHVVQNSRLDWKYLRSRLRKKCVIKNQFNISFKIFRNNIGGIYVDAGFGMQRLYLINPAIGCSNGIIYVIDGFLNYSPFNLIEMIDKETSVSQISTLVTDALTDISDQFLNDEGKFTFFVPGNMALKYHSLEKITSILQEPVYERSKLILRHLITDHILPLSELSTHRLSNLMRKEGMEVTKDKKGTYLVWKGIQARIIKANILASNGIIHVVERFLLMNDKERSASHSSTNAARARTLHTIPPRLHTTPVEFVIPRHHKGLPESHSRPVFATPRITTPRLAGGHSEYAITSSAHRPHAARSMNGHLVLTVMLLLLLLVFTNRWQQT
ncbi:fasciclin-1 [Octopus bimaculoides]|uniref:fasciclin-1 n=1 Tax=Octopus bimaculoides TaxID=37653 RepID=UPI00071DD5EA|nr:fasciclin-1 [Octopus bimaculoides]|eukprot:XP_014788153.1 PREDICTED: fasciclin-1-like [Octopus bimaculoides]